MASLSDVKSRRWWWDSHISPKNSKWLQENLTDMDSKVKQMIKLIEEDADSFARRAEMYYKKRPELMKMVEEFYRAYRALAERYDHATGVIRQAHRTMVEVFPNQDPFVQGDDSPVSSSPREGGPHTPEMPHPIRAMFDPDELNKDDLGLSSSSFRGAPKNGSAEGRTRKSLNFSKAEEKEHQTAHYGENVNIKSRVLSDSERGSNYEREIIILKEALSKLEAEKEVDLLQYKHSLEKLSSLETEVVRAQEDSMRLNERATKAEADALTLKEDLSKLEAEREASNLQYQKCMHTISNLEKNVTLAQENAVELSERASKAEADAQALKETVTKLEAERDVSLHDYQQCLITISNMEKNITLANENVVELSERACKAEADGQSLKDDLTKVKAERDTSLHQYRECLNTISNLEKNITLFQENAVELSERASKAEADAQTLKEIVTNLEAERDVCLHDYQECLNAISKLEKNITLANENVVELSERVCKAEADGQSLKEDLTKVKEERDTSLHQYRECLNTISKLEKNITISQESDVELTERASKAETESWTLKEGLTKVKAEGEATLHRYQECLNTISNLEKNIAISQQNLVELTERASKAETESQTLKEELAIVKTERDASLYQYQECLSMISDLEIKNIVSQENIVELSERAIKAEAESQALKQDLTRVNAEREASLHQYQECLNIISNLEMNITISQETAVELSGRAYKAETESQAAEHALSMAEAEKEAIIVQKSLVLAKLSETEQKLLQAKEDTKRIVEQADKAECDVESLKEALALLTDEKEVAALQSQECLDTISNLESKLYCAQEEAQTLKFEISDGLSKLKHAEESCLHFETLNQTLQSELNSLVQNMGIQNQELSEKQEEIGTLRTCIQEERLHSNETESAVQALQYLQSQSQEELKSLGAELEQRARVLKDLEAYNNGLVDEVHKAKEENKSLNDLSISYQVLIKTLQDEHATLEEVKRNLQNEVELSLGQRSSLQQENNCLKEKINDLDKKCQAVFQQVESVGLNPECFGPVVKEMQDENSKLNEVNQKERNEKVAIIGKLAIMEKLLEKNAVLECSIIYLSAELEAMKKKVTELEETCHHCVEEKSVLVSEKNIIVSQLQNTTENNTFLEQKLSEANAELEGLREKLKSLEDSCELLGTEISVLMTEREGLASKLQIVQQTLEVSEKSYTELEGKCKALDNEKLLKLFKVEELQASIDAARQEHGKLTQLSATRIAELESQLCFSQEESRQRKKELQKKQEETFNSQTEVFILQTCLKDVEGEIISLLSQCQKASELSKKLVSELEHEKFEQDVKVKSLTRQVNNSKTWMYQVLKALGIDLDTVCEDEIVQDVAYIDRILAKIEDQNVSILKSMDEYQQLILDNMILWTLLGQLRLDANNLETEKNTCICELKMRSKEVMELQSNRQYLEEENCVIYSEAVSFSFLSFIFQNTVIEKFLELNELSENLDKIHKANRFMEEKVKILEGNLKKAGMENDQLKESLEKSENELKTVTFVCRQLNNQVSSGSELLHIKESELLEAEKKLRALLIDQAELQIWMEGLTGNFDEVNLIKEDLEKHIHKLSVENDAQSKEGQRLRDMTQRLEARFLTLQERHEETKVREETLTNQLAKWKTEAELWDTEGTSFFTDLQISSIQGAFFAEKIAELTETYHQVNSNHVMEIERLKQSVDTLEEKNRGLECQLVSCMSGISSLECSIGSLENFMLQHLEANKLDKEEVVKDDKLENHMQSSTGDKQNGNSYAKVPDSFLNLQVLESRIKAIENTMIEREKRAVDEHSKSDREIEHNPNLSKPAQEISEAESVTLPKDIMLDQISESSSYGLSKREIVDAESHLLKLWDTTDQNGNIAQEDKRRHPSSEILDKLDISKRFVIPLQEGRKKNILERLDSDLQKLENLQTTVQDLIRKGETREKFKKWKRLEYDTVKDQLQESEEAIQQLFDINKKLTDKVKENALSSAEKSVANSEQSGTIRNIVTEQARRESEKIGRLQLEVQKLQFLLLKFDDEKESKGEKRMSERKTRVILHNFFHGGILRSSSKPKKGSFCACLRPSTKDD